MGSRLKEVSEYSAGELLSAGELSYDEHLEKIRDIHTEFRRNLFALSYAVKDAVDQLGEESLASLAHDLAMGKSTLYQFNAIANSRFLYDYQHLLPDVFTSLHHIVILENQLSKQIGSREKAYDQLATFVEQGRFHPSMSINDVRELRSEVEQIYAETTKETRALNFRKSVSGTTLVTCSESGSLDWFLSEKKVFKTLLITPTDQMLRKYSQIGYTEEDIANEYPIAEINDQTRDGSILGALVIPNRYLPVGMTMLSAWGFSYSDIHARPNKHQLLIGFRGTKRTIEVGTETCIAEQLQIVGKAPFVTVWGDPSDLKDWSHIT